MENGARNGAVIVVVQEGARASELEVATQVKYRLVFEARLL